VSSYSIQHAQACLVGNWGKYFIVIFPLLLGESLGYKTCLVSFNILLFVEFTFEHPFTLDGFVSRREGAQCVRVVLAE